MKYLLRICYLLLIIATCSCADKNPEYDKCLVEIHRLIVTDTDSAFKVLKQMNVEDFVAEHDRAYYAYHYTVALDWLNARSTSDSLIKVAVDYYSEHGDSAMKAKVYYYTADVYEDMGDRKQAIYYYNKAQEETPADSLALKANIYSSWAFMQNNDNFNDETLKLYDDVKKYAREAGGYHLIADAEIHQGWNHLRNGRYDMAIRHYKEALYIAETNSLDYMKFSILNKLANCYAYKKENDVAMYYAKEAIKYVETSMDKKKINGTLCEIYINLKQWDTADSCLRAARLDTADIVNKVMYYGDLSRIKYGKEDYKTAWEMEKKHAESLDSSYKELMRNNSMKYQKMYDVTATKLENSELKVQSQSQQIIIIYGIIVLIVFIAGVSFYIVYKTGKMNEKVKAKDEAMNDVMVTLENKMDELRKVRDVLEDKEEAIREHDRKSGELREALLLKDTELQETREQRRLLKEHIFEMNDVVKKIRQLKKIKNGDLTGKKAVLGKEELEMLWKALDFSHNGVISRLKTHHPDLNMEEMHLCCLLCLKVPSSKIALMLNTSEDSLRQRKSRLKRFKLGLKDNESMEDYISSLEGEDTFLQSILRGKSVDKTEG